MTTLLEKAKAFNPKKTKHKDYELAGLAVAWLHCEITNKQLCASLDRKTTSLAGCLQTVFNALRREKAGESR